MLKVNSGSFLPFSHQKKINLEWNGENFLHTERERDWKKLIKIQIKYERNTIFFYLLSIHVIYIYNINKFNIITKVVIIQRSSISSRKEQ